MAIAVPSSSRSLPGIPRIRPDDHDDRDRPPRDDPQHLRQRVQLPLQRRPGPCHRGQHRRDLAHLGLHPGRGDHDRAGAPGHRGVLEQHVGPVAQRDVGGGQRRRRPWGSARSPRSARPPAPPASRTGRSDRRRARCRPPRPGRCRPERRRWPRPARPSPSRTTRACGTCILASASTLARAVSSCRVPSTTLSTMSSADDDPGRDLARSAGSRPPPRPA